MVHLTSHFIMAGQALLACVLGAIVGFERESRSHPAGIRTYATVCVGACLFGLVSTHAQGAAYYTSIVDPTRIAAQVASGVGFLGAGVIFRDGFNTSGLTTAATIWATAAIGLAIAFDLYILAVFATFIILFLLFLSHIPTWQRMVGKDDDDGEESF